MILPPFFGLLNKYNESEVYQLIQTYLALDVATYTIPTQRLDLTYSTLDIFTYSRIEPAVFLTYNTLDVLTFDTLKRNASYVSYSTCDVLCYELPPTEPGAIDAVIGRDKDSLGIFSWARPISKIPILDYIIEYKSTGELNWILYSDGINTNTSIEIPLTNGTGYQVRVSAINNLGTGLPIISNVVIPSGGIDLDCDLIFFADMDQSDRNQLSDYSCRTKEILTVTNNVTFDNGDGAYGSSWYYDGDIDWSDYPYTYPHMQITKCCDDDWSLVGNFTISLWIKPANINSFQNRTILSSFSEYGFNGNYDNYNNWKLYQFNQNIYFSINDTNILQATGILQTSQYSNIVICRSNNYLSLFIDGNEINSIYYPNNIIINSNFLIIGACHDYYYDFNSSNGRGYTSEGFFGNIDEVILSKSCFYRSNFVPSEKLTIIDCDGCSYSYLLQNSFINDQFIP